MAHYQALGRPSNPWLRHVTTHSNTVPAVREDNRPAPAGVLRVAQRYVKSHTYKLIVV
jgi:hypothetical protein